VSLRFLLDEDISYRVAEGLRAGRTDSVSVHEIGRANKGIPDEDQLRFAATEGRVLVTYNRADFQALDEQWRALGHVHAGILWCSKRTIARRSIGEIIRVLELAASHQDSLAGICLPLRRSGER
jgi:predicted nuclease of predicted toxin-antitoxin system